MKPETPAKNYLKKNNIMLQMSVHGTRHVHVKHTLCCEQFVLE